LAATFRHNLLDTTNYQMLLKELIGKTITNIFEILNYEDGGLDKGECFVELDNTLIIDIPYSFDSFDSEVWIKKLNENAVTVFNDLDKLYPVYHVNKEGKSIKEIIEKYADKKPSLFDKAKQFILGQKPLAQTKHIVEYEPYKVEYVENKFKYIKNRIIIDLITFGDVDEKYFFELDNGYFITETQFSPDGTGRIGINLYEKLIDITSWKGNEFKRLTDHKK
jgi:hypothetical protein